jgi:hypothetical protein
MWWNSFYLQPPSIQKCRGTWHSISDEICIIANDWQLKADSDIACLTREVPLPCRAAKDLVCAFLIWFTQCGRVCFTLHISMNQTRSICVNQMGKTHSKPLAARNGRGNVWARHAMCESALNCAEYGLQIWIAPSNRSHSLALDIQPICDK